MQSTEQSSSMKQLRAERLHEPPKLPPANRASHDLLFGLTICLGAFLLFQVQLIMGKYILPWFGGTPSVWTSCMLVFQILLLAGYLYAHVISSYLGKKSQNLVHFGLMAASLALLVFLATRWNTPITPGLGWKPTAEDNPTLKIIQFLLASIAFPFFLVSTTGPLVQKWYVRVNPGSSPYRLYALSNFGSLLGLLSYPFLIEPNLKIKTQAWIWCSGYLIYAIACFLCSRLPDGVGTELGIASDENLDAPPTFWSRFLWVGLAACASVMLLATTNVICQQVAVIPFLWVLPLCLYLASFILCFESERWYRRSVFQPLFLLLAGGACWLLLKGNDAPVRLQLLVYPALLFVSCMVSHGEIVRTKPAARYLTQFYLLVAIGGVLGGVFTSLIAPHLFTNFWEFHTGIIVSALFLLLALAKDQPSWWNRAPRWLPSALLSAAALLGVILAKAYSLQSGNHISYGLFAIAGLAAAFSIFTAVSQKNELAGVLITRTGALIAFVLLALCLYADANLKNEDVRMASRNFYGTIAIVRADSQIGPYFFLRDRMTNHGFQFVNPNYVNEPAGYYGQGSGISKLLLSHPRPMRVGLIGLGTGTLAAFGRPGDYFRFYEINPAVVNVASGPSAFFTYLRNSKATSDVVLGDARLCLEREAASGNFQKFDVLVIDAFSGDAIPAHLLTKEAFVTYFQHLRTPDSVIALHISNLSLDLGPVVSALAHEFQLQGVRIHHPELRSFSAQTDWVLLSRASTRLKAPQVAAAGAPLVYDRSMPLWTDDYSDLLHIVRFTTRSAPVALAH
jgi:hypothetical protein